MKFNFSTPVSLFLAAAVVAVASLSAHAQAPAAQPAAAPVLLADNAPTRYVVKKGDTLWAIAGRFMKSPWKWNELWRMNKEQIKNPHRIYPGDVLVLTQGADGQPQLTMEDRDLERPTVHLSPEVRVTPIDNEVIASIPPAIIDPFLTKPLVIERNGLENAPKIIGGPDSSRVVLANGYKIYALGIAERDGASWQIYRPGPPLSSPGKLEILGYEAEYLGDAVVEKFAEVSTLTIVSSRKEIVIGDNLVPVPKERIINYPPHAPDKAVEGQIIGMPTSLIESGRDAVVTLDVGTKDGIEIGHVLALYHDPGTVDVWDQKTKYFNLPDKRAVQLPQERIGLAFVFRVFDRVSYALVLNTTKQVELGDWVKKP
jgi:LysM domain